MKFEANKALPVLFIVLGMADLVYGIVRKDMVSLAMGALMAGIAVYILTRRESS